MSAADIATRRAEAVRLLRLAGGWDITADVIESHARLEDLTEAIRVVGDYITDPTEDAADRAALHALALLLAAMTEPT